jgi:hypothetical protein
MNRANSVDYCRDMSSPSFPGEPISLRQFKSWIKNAERTPTISFTEAKERWENQRKRLVSEVMTYDTYLR